MNRLDYIRILEENLLLPLITNEFNNQNYYFQDDNSSVHTANAVQNWIEENNIRILSDFNPIEHLWNELERQLKKRVMYSKNASELEVAVKEEWRQIPFEKLIKSMLRRIEACISSNGWPTSFFVSLK